MSHAQCDSLSDIVEKITSQVATLSADCERFGSAVIKIATDEPDEHSTPIVPGMVESYPRRIAVALQTLARGLTQLLGQCVALRSWCEERDVCDVGDHVDGPVCVVCHPLSQRVHSLLPCDVAVAIVAAMDYIWTSLAAEVALRETLVAKLLSLVYPTGLATVPLRPKRMVLQQFEFAGNALGRMARAPLQDAFAVVSANVSLYETLLPATVGRLGTRQGTTSSVLSSPGAPARYRAA